MHRKIVDKLVLWKNRADRLPLIVMGARQVGKTYSIKEFGSRNFRAMHVFNFEENPNIKKVFESDLKIDRILRELSFIAKSEINVEQDIIFFDEIQACPLALTSLKYFSENIPSLAVCAAGSLLGVTLSEQSFPVGQVEFLHMKPLDFEEFLSGCGLSHESEAFQALIADDIRAELVHDTMWSALKEYYVVGGLPKVVMRYAENLAKNQFVFDGIREIQGNILASYLSDFSKHAGKVNANHIRSVFESIPLQNARAIDNSVGRFRFNEVSTSIKGYSRLKGPIDWLVNCGLVYKVKIANRSEIPLEAFSEENIFKLYLFDIGILGCILDIPVTSIVSEDYGMTKGYFAETYVCQALASSSFQSTKLYSWAEARSEIEFVKVLEASLVPVEVKAGNRLQAKSLATYQKKYSPSLSVKISASHLNYSLERRILNLPLYLSGHLGQIGKKYL